MTRIMTMVFATIDLPGGLMTLWHPRLGAGPCHQSRDLLREGLTYSPAGVASPDIGFGYCIQQATRHADRVLVTMAIKQG